MPEHLRSIDNGLSALPKGEKLREEIDKWSSKEGGKKKRVHFEKTISDYETQASEDNTRQPNDYFREGFACDPDLLRHLDLESERRFIFSRAQMLNFLVTSLKTFLEIRFLGLFEAISNNPPPVVLEQLRNGELALPAALFVL